MFFKSHRFIGSFPEVKQCPQEGVPEFAFAGRSNVGKSSLLNYLANVRGLARISQTPGKTQLINYFMIDEAWHLVDLPGYGYAKVPKTIRSGFQKMITDYIAQSESLKCLFLLIDARVPPQEADLEFTNKLGQLGIPFVLVFTKADKYPSTRFKKNIEDFKKEMLKSWDPLPQIFITSAEKKIGRDALVEFIQDVMKGE